MCFAVPSHAAAISDTAGMLAADGLINKLYKPFFLLFSILNSHT
jgi:hypothetical protein